MTDQEFFTASVLHLRAQKAKAASSGVGCTYRNPSGLKCAIGGVLPEPILDEIARVSLNCTRIGVVMDAIPAAKELLMDVSPVLLGEMQSNHDCYTVSNWEHQFRSTARRFGLEMPE